MIVEEVGRVVYSVLVFYFTIHHSPLQNSHFLAVVRAQRPYYGEIHYRLLGCSISGPSASISGPGCCRGLLKWRTKAMLND